MDSAHRELLYLALAILVMMIGLGLLKRTSRQRGLDRLGRQRRVIRTATPPNHRGVP